MLGLALLGFSFGELIPLFALVIPIVAIIGGITAGIVKTIGDQRIRELAHRERIAALERGVDPGKLPPLPAGETAETPTGSSERRAQGLMIGGLVTLAAGLGLAFMLYFIVQHEAHDQPVWSVAALPIAIGIALLVSAQIVKPKP